MQSRDQDGRMLGFRGQGLGAQGLRVQGLGLGV